MSKRNKYAKKYRFKLFEKKNVKLKMIELIKVNNEGPIVTNGECIG